MITNNVTGTFNNNVTGTFNNSKPGALLLNLGEINNYNVIINNDHSQISNNAGSIFNNLGYINNKLTSIFYNYATFDNTNGVEIINDPTSTFHNLVSGTLITEPTKFTNNGTFNLASSASIVGSLGGNQPIPV